MYIFIVAEDTTFISDDGIEWLFARTDFSEIVGNKDSIIESASVNKIDAENKTISFIIDSDRYNVNMKLGDDNKWQVALDFDSDYVTENFKVYLPYTKCMFNDIAIPDAYVTYEVGDFRREYTLPVVVRKPSDFVIDAGELGMLTYHSESMRPNSDNNNNTWDCFPGIDITPEQESQLCEAVETQANNFVSAAEAYAYNNADFALTDWMPAEVLQSDIDNMRDICNSMVRSKSVADVLYNERSFSAFTLVNKPCFLYTITKGGVPVYGCYFDLTCRGKSCINGFSNWYACEDTKTTTDLIFAVEDGKIKFVYSTPGCFFDKQLS